MRNIDHHPVGIILAAGQSSRMNAIKPIMPLAGKSALERLTAAYRFAGIEDIRIVLGYHADIITDFIEAHPDLKNVTVLLNTDPSRGMFSSVQTALQSLDATSDGAFLLPADIPLIKGETIRFLTDNALQNPDHIMIPTFNGQRGHPPWIPAARIKAIVEASAAKSTLRDFLSNDILEIPCVDSCTLMDMDTPAAYEALCHLAPLRDYPTPDECRAIWTLLRVPEPVRRHSMAVTNVALTIGGLINQKSNQTLNLDKLSAAAMLHDIMKGCSDHAKAGAEMMMKFGFSGISEAIACHMKLTVDGIPNVVGISEILYLSDKLCTEDVCISLELRLKSALDRYPSSAADFIKERFQTAMRLQKAVERITHSVSLDAYLSRACQ